MVKCPKCGSSNVVSYGRQTTGYPTGYYCNSCNYGPFTERGLEVGEVSASMKEDLKKAKERPDEATQNNSLTQKKKVMYLLLVILLLIVIPFFLYWWLKG